MTRLSRDFRARNTAMSSREIKWTKETTRDHVPETRWGGRDEPQMDWEASEVRTGGGGEGNPTKRQAGEVQTAQRTDGGAAREACKEKGTRSTKLVE